MPRRARNGRFVRGGARRSRRTVRARFGAIRSRASGGLAKFRGRVSGAFSGMPKWARPSNVAAATGVATGIGVLLFTPLPGGDGWVKRLHDGYGTYQETKNPFDILHYDENGYGAIEVAVAQMQQNAPKAILDVAGFGIGAAVLRYFGM